MEEKKRILIIDDTIENINVLGEGLNDLYMISAAKNGVKGLSIAMSDKKPDLILLDIMMPEMDGYEVLQRLKKEEISCNIPVIFVSAMTEVTDKTKGFELGAVDYITKPFQLSEVRARVKTHLELTDARKTLIKQNQQLIEDAALKEDVEHIIRHDLKGPLNSIIGIPQVLMAEESISEDQKTLLELILNSGHKMLNMIDLSLDIFKMEKGIFEPQLESIPLYSMFNKILTGYSDQLSHKNISIHLDFSVDLACKGDELLCYSLFSNILRNAVEASPKDKIISVTASLEDSSVSIHIKNNGEVPQEVQGSFFEKYVTSGKSSGTGLGTYSAALICRNLNGSIQLNSSEVGYTTVTISLPE